MPDSIFDQRGTEVTVDAAGALTGNGSAADPLAVSVDGATIEINGSNELAMTGALPTDSTITVNGIGTTSTDGLVLENTTDAAAGAQQYSPRLRLRGEGWKTDATAGSQTVDYALEVQPVQGTSAPTGNLILKASINGGAFSTVGTFTSAGNLTVPGDGTFNGLLFGVNITSIAGGYIHNTNRSGFTSPVDGTFRIQNWAFDNYLDVLTAAWGTTLSAEGVSVADAATLNLGAAPLGSLTFTVGTDNLVGKFQLRGSSNAVVADDGNDAIFTTTKDTASSINVYFDTNAYFIQNTRGGARTLRNLLTGA